MKNLLSKILFAQIAAVVLALLVVMIITRVSLQRGFANYLEQWESAQLASLVPELEVLYSDRGGWRSLRLDPRAWERLLRLSRPAPGGPKVGPGERFSRRPEGAAPGLHRMRMLERMRLNERLFLLDAERRPVVGRLPLQASGHLLQAIEVDGAVVGWVGFSPVGRVLPPEARRFLGGQRQVLVVSLLIGLLFAALLGFLLARHLSRPVTLLAGAVSKLSDGAFETRAAITSNDEIGVLAAQINALAATLEKNRSARRRWMADIAHELRTPVAIMKGEIEALEDGVRPPGARLSASLREEIDQLSALIDDLQTLALADSGALSIRKEPLDLSALVAHVAEIYRERLAQRGIRLATDIEDSVVLAVDPRRVRQLLQNLFENSWRYVQQGGRVELRLTRCDGMVELVLADDGPGVDAQQLARLFRRFYRANGSRPSAGRGSGLGLPICRHIVEAHGGSIDATHSVQGGLELTVRLPAGNI